MSLEKPSAKDFGFEVLPSNREGGQVSIVYEGRTFKWFLREDGQTLVLIDGDERTLSLPALNAMKKQAFAILKPALNSHNRKNLHP